MSRREMQTATGAFIPLISTVSGRRRETKDTVTLAIESQATPEPGQFNMLYAHGIGEIPISFSGIGADGVAYHTVRRVGAVSQAIAALKVGDQVAVRGPYGTSWPKLHGRHLLIVAGGLGLAPLRPAIQQVFAMRDSYGDVGIYVGARSPNEVLFARDLSRWRAKYCDRRKAGSKTEIRLTVDRLEKSPSDWQGEVGLVTALLPKSLREPGKTSALICGPEVMMRHVAQDLNKLGVAAEDIYLSLERNMKCAVGLCGHCQFNRYFVCRDGPVFSLAAVEKLLTIKEL